MQLMSVAVTVKQAVEYRCGDDLALEPVIWRRRRFMKAFRNMLVDALMGSLSIEIVSISRDNSMQLMGMKDEEIVCAFSFKRAHKTFTQGIGSGSPGRCVFGFDTGVLEQVLELVAKLTIVIMNEISGTLTPGRGFPNLLRRPFVSGIGGDGRMYNPARFMFHDHKDIERFEEERVDGGKVTSPDFVSMILEKSAPVLTP